MKKPVQYDGTCEECGATPCCTWRFGTHEDGSDRLVCGTCQHIGTLRIQVSFHDGLVQLRKADERLWGFIKKTQPELAIACDHIDDPDPLQVLLLGKDGPALCLNTETAGGEDDERRTD